MENLICNNIVKNYGKKEVLKGVNLTLEQGKIYGLIGRNGAGKTTLLSIISAQNSPTSGDVLLRNEKVWENQNALDHICFSRELNAYGGKMSNISALKVKEYLRIASIYFPNWDHEMANKLVKEFELNTKDRINKLSKGMTSMVTIIVALASKAEYTFLDEPVAGLDVIMREYFYQILLEEYSNTGRTFIIFTHIIEEAADVFEEVIMVKDGVILLKENTQELLERAFRVSGITDEVEQATKGLSVHHKEKNGRATAVTVLLKPGEKIAVGHDVSVQPLNLQNVFTSLCGKGE